MNAPPMKHISHRTLLAGLAASLIAVTSGCHSNDSHSRGSGTHRMGTPKENYRMSNDSMPSGQRKPRAARHRDTDRDGTHRMGTPKQNYRMSNDRMRRN